MAPLFRILAVFLMLWSIWSQRLPVSLKGQTRSTDELVKIIGRADRAQAVERWSQAVVHYEQALELAEGIKRADIAEKLKWCRVQMSVKDRYLDGSVAEYISTVSVKEAEALFSETLDLIQVEYHEQFDRRQQWIESLYGLEAAAKNKTCRSHFKIEDGASEALLREISNLRQQCQGKSSVSRKEMLEAIRFLTSLSEEAGLGGGWPATELAYAYADILDKYSYLLSPKQFTMLCDQLEGAYVGIGVELVFEGVFPTVFDVIVNGPAEQNGIRPGDILIKVGQVSLREKSVGETGKLLSGAAQTEVEITLQRGAAEQTVRVTRALVSSANVRYAQLMGAKERIGYVRVASFDNYTAMELRQAVEELKVSGAKSLLIDLRSNGGGVMTSAIDAVRLFINRGKIVTVKRSHETTRYEAEGGYKAIKLPLALLVDENTASAAEIFAAAIQDHGRGVLIGQTTLGKGVVQTLYPLDYCPTGLCITTATYLPPSNQSFNMQGIKPDILVENPRLAEKKVFSMSDLLNQDDETLQAGISFLEKYGLVFKNTP